MRFDEYRRYDGLGLAALVTKKEVSPHEPLEAALARADEVNPRLNAVVQRMDTIARDRAKVAPSGPFAGVPFLEKDLGQEYAGVPCSYGSSGLKRLNYAPAVHAEITERWLKSGAVIFGRTNTPEFGMQLVTEPRAWGAAHNPWTLERSPGGSSGGSAAAVAAGIAPLAGANDLGGSIRVPASVCGLFGFKPGRGRTPWGPERGEMMLGAAINHVISRSVRDSAAMLDATQGPELASGFVIAPPDRPYLDETTCDGEPLRIAFSTGSPLGEPVDPEARQAVENAARLLESLGHFVEPAEPPIDGEQVLLDWGTLLFAGGAEIVAEARRRAKCRSSDFEPDPLLLARLGRALRADELAASLEHWQAYRIAMNVFHQRYEIYMTPTTAASAPLIGQTKTPRALGALGTAMQNLGQSRLLMASGQVRKLIRSKVAWAPFAMLANLTGAPAMSVPLHWAKDGAPWGVHFMAAATREGTLFQLAAQLERAAPWFDRVPAL